MRLLIGGALLLAGFIVGKVAFFVQEEQFLPPPSPLANVTQTKRQAVRVEDIDFEVFVDMQCPHCAKLLDDITQLRRAYPRLPIRYRHFPLDARCNSAQTSGKSHAGSCELSRLALCLPADKNFEDWHRSIYESSLRGATVAELISTTQASPACVTSDATASRLSTDIETALRRGVNGTPAIFVNGVRLVGGYDFGSLNRAVLRARLNSY